MRGMHPRSASPLYVELGTTGHAECVCNSSCESSSPLSDRFYRSKMMALRSGRKHWKHSSKQRSNPSREHYRQRRYVVVVEDVLTASSGNPVQEASREELKMLPSFEGKGRK